MRAEVVGAAFQDFDVGRGVLLGDAEHFGFGVQAGDVGGVGRKSLGELAGAATQVENAVGLGEVGELGNPGDEGRGVGRAADKIVGCGGAEAAGFKGEDSVFHVHHLARVWRHRGGV
jgi:hypothetical protein